MASKRGQYECAVILDITDINDWAFLQGNPHIVGMSPQIIPQDSRPTVLQADEADAEIELKRLASMHQGRKFLLLKGSVVCQARGLPTHITLGGIEVGRRVAPVMLEIDASDDGIPL